LDGDNFAEKLRRGAYLMAEPRTTGDGYYEAIAWMPDGILIEIVAD
jgi:lactoylglutathione lyase